MADIYCIIPHLLAYKGLKSSPHTKNGAFIRSVTVTQKIDINRPHYRNFSLLYTVCSHRVRNNSSVTKATLEATDSAKKPCPTKHVSLNITGLFQFLQFFLFPYYFKTHMHGRLRNCSTFI